MRKLGKGESDGALHRCLHPILGNGMVGVGPDDVSVRPRLGTLACSGSGSPMLAQAQLSLLAIVIFQKYLLRQSHVMSLLCCTPGDMSAAAAGFSPLVREGSVLFSNTSISHTILDLSLASPS